jgi:hypothetical protein
MLDFLHRTYVLHVLLNMTYVGLGIVAGRFLAWRVGLERRFIVRSTFLRQLVVLAVAIAILITLLIPESRHLAAGIVLGLLTGFGASYLSRAQAKPKETPGETPRRPW